MTIIECDVAVIGAGTAGLAAWKAATDAGAHALLIDDGPGGTTCARVGCMPSKLLIAAARAAHDARRSDLFGIRTGPVAVDGAAVMERVGRERDYFVQAVLDDLPPADRTLHGQARFTGPGRLAVGDTEIVAKAIVIATGSHPEIPEPLEPVRDKVLTTDTVFEQATLPGALAVLGAGAVGLELAAAFARLGTQVTLFDKAEAIASLDEPDIADCARRLIGAEFAIRLGCEVTAAPDGEGVRIDWTGAERGSARFDAVLAAAGRPPSLKPLDLDKAGIDLDERGTPLFDPETRRCGESMVFVAGDAGARRPVLHEASQAGKLAGRNAARPDAIARQRILPAFSIVFTDPEIVRVGMDHGDLPDDAVAASGGFADNGRIHIDAAGDGVLRLYAASDGTLLGGVAVGAGAEQIGHLLAMAIAAGLSADDLADQAYYHPTIPEILQTVARDLAAAVARVSGADAAA